MKIMISYVILVVAMAVASSTYAAPGGPGGPRGPGGPGGPDGYAFDRGNVAGWSMMTRDERTEYRNKMYSAKTYDECKAYQDEHRKMMETRGAHRGMGMMQPRHDACDRMRERGIVK